MDSGAGQTPTAVSVAGSAVTLTLSAAVTSGQTVRVSYTAGTNPIRDLAQNNAANLSSQAVTNNTVDAWLISNIGKANSGNAAFSAGNSAQGFTTGASPAGYTLDSIELVAIAALDSRIRVLVRETSPSGTRVASLSNPSSVAAGTLTFSAPSGSTLAASTTYYVVLENPGTITDGSLGITTSTAEDSGGRPGWSIEDTRRRSSGSTWSSVSNPLRIRVNGSAKDATAPALRVAFVNGTSLKLDYSEALDTGSTPATTDFTVTVAGTDQTPSNVGVAGSAVTLTLGTAATAGQTVTVAYTKGSNPIRDLAGNDAAALSSQAVNNITDDTTLPTFSSATVKGTSLVVRFSEAMDTGNNSNPFSTAFVVTATDSGGTVRTIEGTGTDRITIDGAKVTAILASAVAAGETVTVAYRANAEGFGRKVRDLAGNLLADFSGQAVANVTGDNTAPTFDSATVNGAVLEITFNEDLDTTSKPIGSRFGVAATQGGTTRHISGTFAPGVDCGQGGDGHLGRGGRAWRNRDGELRGGHRDEPAAGFRGKQCGELLPQGGDQRHAGHDRADGG